MKEVWKDVKNYEGLYKISNYGNIKRKECVINNPTVKGNSGKCKLQEKDIKSHISQKGYYQVWLYKNGIKKGYQVHRLVLETFKLINNNILKNQVNHKDCNKKNNFINNLEWVTCKQNIHHAIKNGLHVNPKILNGENAFGSKLNSKQVKEIRDISKNSSLTQLKIAKLYDISQTNVSDIINNKRWKHI